MWKESPIIHRNPTHSLTQSCKRIDVRDSWGFSPNKVDNSMEARYYYIGTPVIVEHMHKNSVRSEMCPGASTESDFEFLDNILGHAESKAARCKRFGKKLNS